MIITHLAVEGVGRFRARHVVQGLGPGLNLLCAPNEAGKSTLFRALQHALFARHGSKHKDIGALACLGAELPAVVEVGFRRGSDDYLIRKSFLRSTGAKFFRAGTLVADGRAADEAVWATLELTPGTSAADESAFGLLWVPQGQSFRPIEPTEDTRALLSRIIEAEVGEVLGGERGERVWRRVTERLAEEETARGPKAGGTWKAALDRRAAAQAELAELRRTLEALEADRAALLDRLRERDALADPTGAARLRTDLAAAEAEVAAAMRADQAAQQAETEQAQRELMLDRARKRHEDLLALDQRIARARERIAAEERRAAEERDAAAAQATALAARERDLGEVATRLAEAERAVDTARRRETAARDAERVAELTARLDRARRLRDEEARLRQAIARLAVPAEAVRRIESAQGALDAARARLEAKAPRVRVRLGPAGAGRVTCGGEPIADGGELVATSPLAVAVADLATIEIVPAASEDAGAVAAARDTLARVLREAGVASLAEAHERRTQAVDLDSERRAVMAELAALAPSPTTAARPPSGGKPGAGSDDGLGALERALAEARAGLDALGAAPGEDLPDRAALARAREAAEQQRDALRRAHADAQAGVAAARQQAAAEAVRLDTLVAGIEEQKRQLATDLAASPDDRRAGALVALAAEAAEARAAFEAAARQAADRRAAVPGPDEREAVAARVRRLAEAIRTRDARLNAAEQEIARLQGRIATRGGEGLGEREAAAVEALALAETEVAAIERRLAALRLLRDTLEAGRRAAQDSFVGPVKAALRPYLHALFPGADAALADLFAVDGLTRAGSAEPFLSLSDGTREQIAIIVRLGLGRLLAERGRPVPVVLDDSLVFSDDDRIERMFDVLTRAAEKQQVIVLTCRSRAFLSCGGRTLSIVQQDG